MRNVGRDGGGKALFRRKGKIVHAGGGVERRNDLHAQRIDLPLNQQLANGLHRLLQSRDRTVPQDRTQQLRADAPLPALRAKLRHTAHHIHHCQHRTGSLCRHGGNGTADNAKPQSADKNQVQHDVQHCRKRQKFQRRFGIPHAFQPRRQCIIKKGKRRTQKGDAQVNAGDVCNFGRHSQQAQQLRRDRDARQRHPAAKQCAEQQGGCQRLAQAFGVPGTVGFAHQNARADAQPRNCQNHKVHHRGGDALGGKGILPDKPPRYNGIRRIVGKLQPVAEKQRHSVEKQVLQRGAFCHITHKFTPQKQPRKNSVAVDFY